MTKADDYKNWPRPKMQVEYLKLKDENARLKLLISKAEERMILVDDFLLSFRMLVESGEEEAK